VNACEFCKALQRLATIDDVEADAIVANSDMSGWCHDHLRAWIDTRSDGVRGRERLERILKRAGRSR